MKVVLDGRKMTDKETAHEYLQEQLGFPEYYGCNLDALYDCLLEIEEEIILQIVCTEEIKENLGDYADALLETIQDAALENPNLQLTEIE
ncbi:MAG: barnase inhibitor [Lachnospiraceae bacterium]|nr:barnase inhibitor [Lachnospiraceae bacterium]